MSAEAIPESQTYTVDEYLALEEKSEVKHEFVHGHICAMSGGTRDHDTIANNVRAALVVHLRGSRCRPNGPDFRVRVSPDLYYYPDAVVDFDDNTLGVDRDARTPRLIVEVLSESTGANDRGEKFANYQSLASLEEYALVDSRRVAVEIFRRNGVLWDYQRFTGDATFTLKSVGMSWRVADLYEDTGIGPASEEPTDQGE